MTSKYEYKPEVVSLESRTEVGWRFHTVLRVVLHNTNSHEEQESKPLVSHKATRKIDFICDMDIPCLR